MLSSSPNTVSRAAANAGNDARTAGSHCTEGEDLHLPEHELRVQLVGGFEGLSLVTLACDHEPAWLASEIARIVELDEQGLIERLAERWAERCPSGALVYLGRGQARELIEQLDRAHVVLATTQRRRPLVLLRAIAIDELVALVDTPAARRLRNHLHERVIPEFHAWERAARALEQPLLSSDAVTIAGNRLEFERRCFEAAVLERLLDRLEHAGLVDGDLLTTYRVVASELALGGRLSDFAEELAHGWATPTQIAARWQGLTPMRVGKLITSLGLKGSRAHSRAFLNKARGHDRTVITHVYSPAAVALVERELRSRSHRRIDDPDLEAAT